MSTMDIFGGVRSSLRKAGNMARQISTLFGYAKTPIIDNFRVNITEDKTDTNTKCPIKVYADMMIDVWIYEYVCINDAIIKEMEAKSHPVHKAKSLHRPQSVSGKESEVLTFAPLPEKHLVRTEWEHSDSLLHMQSLPFRKMCQIYVEQCKFNNPKSSTKLQAFCIPCPAWSIEGMTQKESWKGVKLREACQVDSSCPSFHPLRNQQKTL